MMRLGPATGAAVVFAPPLFEEANRTRAVVAATMRALASRGIASALPDLPGQGESLVPTGEATLSGLRAAFAAAAASIRAEDRPVFVVAIRSGALLDPLASAHGRWHLSPQEGRELMRELARVKQGQAGHEGKRIDPRYFDGSLDTRWPLPPVSIAGNAVGARLLNELATATLHDGADVPTRTVRLEGDPRPADRHFAAPPPWRRAEPKGDDALSQALATDIAAWMRTCDAR